MVNVIFWSDFVWVVLLIAYMYQLYVHNIIDEKICSIFIDIVKHAYILISK